MFQCMEMRIRGQYNWFMNMLPGGVWYYSVGVWVMLNFIVCNINVSVSVVHETFQSNSNHLSDGLFSAPSVQNKNRTKRSRLCVHLHASLSTTLNFRQIQCWDLHQI